MNKAVFPGIQGGPLDARDRRQGRGVRRGAAPSFRAYIARVVDNAQVMAARLVRSGLLKLVSGGTDNHLMLVDLGERSCPARTPKRRSAKRGITVNKNTVPGEKRSPDGHLGRAHRHPGDDHPRPDPPRTRHRGEPDRRRARPPTRPPPRARAAGDPRAVLPYPVYPADLMG
jgi:hypothetical protein